MSINCSVEKLGYSSFSEKIVLLGVILFPFQQFAVRMAQSRYDLTSFILLIASLYVTFKHHRVSRQTLIYMWAFIVWQLCVYMLFNVAPYHRLISGIVWLGGLFLILLSGDKFHYSPSKIFKIIMFVLSLSAFYILAERVLSQDARPRAWFGESSYAGMALYGAAAGCIISIYLIKMSKRMVVFLIVFFLVCFSSALLTFSMHFVTFIITILLFIILDVFSKPLLLISPKKTCLFLTIGILLILIANLLFTMEHYYSRINLLDSQTNLSVLAWLRGYDQMVATILNSPILGNGLGSTGYFEFNSVYALTLDEQGMGVLNLTDAYSLAFRLVIEIGLPMTIIFMIYFGRRLNIFRQSLRILQGLPASQAIPVVFNFVFAVSLILGALLKEPLYSNSVLYLAVFLFATSLPLPRPPIH